MTYILIGNKTDLESRYQHLIARRAISYDEGLKVAQTYDMEFCETSALQDFNVKVAFSRSAIKILHKINKGLLTINKDVSSSN